MNNPGKEMGRYFLHPGSSTSPRGFPSTMKMLGCDEMFTEFLVDAERVRQRIPQGYKLKIHPVEKAMFLMLVQQCKKVVLDRVLPISPLRMVHLWIELDGPEEVGETLQGTTSSLPTSYWYTLPHQMDNLLAYLAFRMVGIDIQFVRQISIEGSAGGLRRGEVIEQENPRTGYSWTESGSLWHQANLVTGRRWFYRHYGKAIRRRSGGLVVCRSNFTGEGSIQLKADPGSAIGRLGVGSILQGVTKSVEIECEVTIKVGSI